MVAPLASAGSRVLSSSGLSPASPQARVLQGTARTAAGASHTCPNRTPSPSMKGSSSKPLLMVSCVLSLGCASEGGGCLPIERSPHCSALQITWQKTLGHRGSFYSAYYSVCLHPPSLTVGSLNPVFFLCPVSCFSYDCSASESFCCLSVQRKQGRDSK